MESKKQQELIDRLFSPDEQVVLKALEAIKEDGSAKMVEPLMTLVCKTGEDWALVSERALHILSSLKDSKAHTALLKAIDKEEFSSQTDRLLSAIWQSDINASEDVAKIVRVALKANYMAIFEAITIIESCEYVIPEDQIIESQLAVKFYLNENPKSEKLEIVENLLNTLNKMESYE